MMAKFIDSLTNQQEKQFYLNQGFTFKIDIDQSLLILAANQQTDQLFQQDQTTETMSTQDKPLNEVILMKFYSHTFYMGNVFHISLSSMI